MNRGVLKLINTEAEELLKNFNTTNFQGTPLANKLGSINLNKPEIEILLSEDEAESIVDQIGMVDPSSNPNLSSAINKVMELIGSFHENQNTIS
jgi:hypothetical protein